MCDNDDGDDLFGMDDRQRLLNCIYSQDHK